MIAISNIRKSFGDLVAVDGLSLEIPTGQTLGLLGPNGAGKTTTIRLIVGALIPNEGSITIDGKPADSTLVRSTIGMAPQSLAIYDDLTAEENLRFFASLYGISGKDLKERVAWALDFAQLTDRAKDRAGTFSGGMKRRLNMATALVHDPPILLLDEPTVGVDPQSRNHIFESIETLQEQGRTIIYTSHYMEEIQRMCDHVAIMDHGKLLDAGSSEELIQRHASASRVTAELVSLPDDTQSLPGTVTNRTWSFESHNPFQEITKATSDGVGIESMHMTRPDLESVFLNLTGRTLRD